MATTPTMTPSAAERWADIQKEITPATPCAAGLAGSGDELCFQLGQCHARLFGVGAVVRQPRAKLCALGIGDEARRGIPQRAFARDAETFQRLIQMSRHRNRVARWEINPLRQACARIPAQSWQMPTQPAPAYSAAAMRLRTASAPSVRARYRASDSVSASKA